MSLIQQTCKCGTIYFARSVDLKRGWGKSCSKSCAAVKRTKRELSGNHKLAEASKKYNSRKRDFDMSVGSKLWNDASDAQEVGWDAHKEYCQ